MDPVVIGRNIFHVTNDTVSGIFGYIQDVLCAIVDMILDVFKGIQCLHIVSFVMFVA